MIKYLKISAALAADRAELGRGAEDDEEDLAVEQAVVGLLLGPVAGEVELKEDSHVGTALFLLQEHKLLPRGVSVICLIDQSSLCLVCGQAIPCPVRLVPLPRVEAKDDRGGTAWPGEKDEPG